MRELHALKDRLRRDAPDRYDEILDMLGRLYSQARNSRYELQIPTGGGEPLEPNCSYPEAIAAKTQFLNFALRLVEHNTGKPSESKEVKEERRLILEIKGWDPQMFRLPPAIAQNVLETSVKEMVGDAG